MFEFPEAKRVRREDLNGPDESGWSDHEEDAELEARLNAQIARSLGLDEDSYGPPRSQAVVAKPREAKKLAVSDDDDDEDEPDAAHGEEGEGPEDAGYTFRLFSMAGPAPKVVLEDDDEVQEGGLVKPRPLSYYLVTDISAEQKRRYAYAAVSGEDVIARSRWRSWGLEFPWKVTTIKVTRRARPGESANPEADPPNKRRRPGKKLRIALRTKARANAQAQEAVAKQLAEKDENLKEKKKRLNRLKKLRKRAKNKEKKMATGAGAGAEESDDDSSAAE